MASTHEHYLESELNNLIQSDPKMWSFLQQGSLDGVWYWDLENPEAEWMSPEMWRLLGIDPATKRHDPAEWQDLIFQDDLQVALQNFEKHCADPDHPYDQIVRYRHADGSTVWVRCRGIAIRDASGKPIRMLGAHNDLTAVKRAEEATKSALRETAAANEELHSFAYGISHDLKAPASTMRMLLDEIIGHRAENLTDTQRELLGLAQDTAEQMCHLVEEMLAYTRIIGQEPEWSPVSLRETAEKVCSLLAKPISEAGAQVTIDDRLPMVPGNATQLRTLMQNLIENALKYRDPDRSPVVRVEALQDSRGFLVSDNGIGIAEEHQSRVFEMFKRLHRNDEISGTGLGLTLCQRVVMNHGGDIHVASELNRGSTFTVFLPRQCT
ncbi:MAG: PAS domain-containing sensor histidine kinase [Pseudomonadota bacterium]